jgi:RimJ/RimL family protein N-acetyltransferase
MQEPFVIRTENLDLLNSSARHIELLKEDEPMFEKEFGFKIAKGYLEFPEALEFIHSLLAHGPGFGDWGFYLFIHRKDKALIGAGGFKGRPNNGVVEIGYGTAVEYRNKGLATEAALAFIRFAFKDPSIIKVIAHTRPEENASNHILVKLKFVRTDDYVDSVDGLVWRFEMTRSMYFQRRRAGEL